MIKLTITNSDNTKMSVDLIRYFRFKNDCFLIYSMGEVDEKNHQICRFARCNALR